MMVTGNPLLTGVPGLDKQTLTTLITKWTEHPPVVVAYESYRKMPYDRPTWDLTSVLYAVEGLKDYFTISGPGKISADKAGYTFFSPSPHGKHFYLMTNEEQQQKIKQRFLSLITRNPKS